MFVCASPLGCTIWNMRRTCAPMPWQPNQKSTHAPTSCTHVMHPRHAPTSCTHVIHPRHSPMHPLAHVSSPFAQMVCFMVPFQRGIFLTALRIMSQFAFRPWYGMVWHGMAWYGVSRYLWRGGHVMCYDAILKRHFPYCFPMKSQPILSEYDARGVRGVVPC